jgi:thiamine-phosphate pyrophosphorylase
MIEKFFIFIDRIDNDLENNLSKFKNLSIIYKPNHKGVIDLHEFKKIKKFCKFKKVKLYIVDDFKIAIKLGVNGIFISSNNKKKLPRFKKNFTFIGSVHSQLEFYFKLKQNCKYIFLSPLFKNIKYSDNQILNPIKFNLMSLQWKVSLVALGGINSDNFKKVYLTKSHGLAFISWIKTAKIKKPVHFNNVRAFKLN